jgi:hypothetical protein
MNYKTPVLIWLYMVVTTVGEVFLFYSAKPDTFSVTVVIGAVAMVNSLIAAIFLMNIRKEPPVIQYMILAPLALVMVLVLTLLFALAQ